MEAPQLRPLGVGDIVDRVFALYRARPWILIVASAVPYLVFVLVIAAVTLALAASIAGLAQFANILAGGETPDPAFVASAVTGFIWFVLFVVVAAVIILSVQTAALVHATSARYLGRDVTIGQAFSAGMRAAPRVILAGLAIFFLFIAMWIALVIVMVLTRSAGVAVLLTLAGLIASVFIFASTLVTPVVATLESAGPISAIQRSFSLSAGSRWRIIGIQFLLVIINAVLSAIVSTIFLTSLIGDVALRTAAQQITNALVTILWAPVEWGTFTILYYDLRVRREAFDLQLAAEALPREA